MSNNVFPIPLEIEATTLPLPTGAATAANQLLGLTDTQLRATPVPVSGTVTTTGLTDTQLRATPVPVSGTVAATQSGTWNIGTVTTITNVVHIDDNGGSITVDGTLTSIGSITNPVAVTGTFWQATQPVSIAAAVSVTQGTSPWVTNDPGLPNALGQATAANSTSVVLASDQSTVPVSAASLPLPSGAATSAKQDTMIANLQTINALTPTIYDYIGLSYTGDDLTTVLYKTGGSGGTTVSTLTLAYSSSILQSVTKT